ncbi:MAG: hypothetical protein R3F37_20895 [Candidatus Competibacteraceae bacterium]
MLGKRYGFVTPGRNARGLFQIRCRALVDCVGRVGVLNPYLGVQLRASGFLFNVLTDGALDVEVGMWLLLQAGGGLAGVSGGMRAVAYVDTMQCIPLAGVISPPSVSSP